MKHEVKDMYRNNYSQESNKPFASKQEKVRKPRSDTGVQGCDATAAP